MWYLHQPPKISEWRLRFETSTDRNPSLAHTLHSAHTSQHLARAMDFQPLQALPSAPRASSSTNPHSRHFHSFRHPLFIKHAAPVTHIHFSPAKPYRYAATASTRVIVYAPKTGKVVKTVTRFKDVARCGEFRKDGKLMVAGSDDGLVQIFDVGSRAVLRTMKDHNQ